MVAGRHTAGEDLDPISTDAIAYTAAAAQKAAVRQC
jgi:hypothetical protein